MKKKIRTNKCITFIMALCLLICCQFSVNADSQKGSVEIYCHGITSDGERTELSNAEFVMYRVGEYINGEWTLTQEFAPSGAQLGDMSASYQREAAKILYSYANANDFGSMSAVTDINGKAMFTQLDLGLYLVSMKNDYQYNNGIFRSAPFLLTMPISENDTIMFDFTVEPKVEWSDEEEPSSSTEPTEEPSTEPTQPTSPTSTTSPTASSSTKPTDEQGSQQTGQSSLPLQISISLIMMSLFVILLFKRRKSN